MDRPEWAYMRGFSMNYLRGWHWGYRKAIRDRHWKGTPWDTGQSHPTEHIKAGRRSQEAGL